MSEKKSKTANVLLKVENLIIIVFLISFVLWAVSKCNNKRLSLQQQTLQEQNQNLRDSLIKVRNAAPSPTVVTPIPPVSPAKTVQSQQPHQPLANPPTTITQTREVASPRPSAPATSGTKLYVVLDKLKIREEPGLAGRVLGELPLHTELIFMNETTKNTQKINIGTQTVEEPWVKVKTKRGTVGWVFGGGISYYKTKK